MTSSEYAKARNIEETQRLCARKSKFSQLNWCVSTITQSNLQEVAALALALHGACASDDSAARCTDNLIAELLLKRTKGEENFDLDQSSRLRGDTRVKAGTASKADSAGTRRKSTR